MRSLFALLLALVAACTNAQITNISRRSADYKTIIRLVGVAIKDGVAYPVRVEGDIVRRSGNYAFVYSSLPFVNPKHQGDGMGMALLKKSNGRWKVVESVVGSGGMSDLANDWAKKYRLPKKLVAGVMG